MQTFLEILAATWLIPGLIFMVVSAYVHIY